MLISPKLPKTLHQIYTLQKFKSPGKKKFSMENTQILRVCCPLVVQHLRTVALCNPKFLSPNQIQPQLLYSMISWQGKQKTKTKLQKPDHMRQGIFQHDWNYRSLQQRWQTSFWRVPHWSHTPDHIRATFLDHFLLFTGV